jgi:O-antigen biosynthesis protein
MNSSQETESISPVIYERQLYDRVADGDAEDSIGKIFRRIPVGSRILDIGVGCGVLGKIVQERQIGEIDGIDSDPGMLHRSRPYYRDLFQADLDAVSAKKIVGERKYDVIVLADVIEHLRLPARTVAFLAEVLEPHGKLLFSVPNITYVGVICELASGHFRYRPEGLLDSTHLRFFSFDSLSSLITDSGLVISHYDRVEMPLTSSEFKELNPTDYVNLEQVKKNPHWLTYQFILEATATEAFFKIPESFARACSDSVFGGQSHRAR